MLETYTILELYQFLASVEMACLLVIQIDIQAVCHQSQEIFISKKVCLKFSHMSKSDHKFAKYSNMGFSCQIVNQAW